MISVIIPYCSFERDLIDDVVKSLEGFEIIIISLTHTFDGKEDDTSYIETLPVKRILIPWFKHPANRYWINTMRLIGFSRATKDWLLFMDSDEVLNNKDEFMNFFKTVNEDTSYKMGNYWYFLSKKRRSKTLEDSIVLIHRKWIHADLFKKYDLEREYLVAKNHKRNVGNWFDHYSWVRSKDVLLKKVDSWAHKNEKPWKSLIEKAFSEDILTTKDFVHNYEYEILN